MASKKFVELQDFTDPELRDELSQTETQYKKMRFDHAIKGLDNPLVLKEVRRDIARMQTEVRQREISKMSSEDLAGRTKTRARRKNS